MKQAIRVSVFNDGTMFGVKNAKNSQQQ